MFQYNLSLSEAYQEKYQRHIREKACYNNVYNLVTRFIIRQKDSDEWEVMFCYLSTQNMTPVYMRHVFLLYCGEIVEPLARMRKGVLLDSILPFARLSLHEYVDSLLVDGQTDCRTYFLQEELEALNNHHAIINPFEVSDFVMQFSKSLDEFLTLSEAASRGDYTPFIECSLPIST